MNDKIDNLRKQIQEELENKRSQNALIEKAQIACMSRFLEKERERFDYADTSQYLLQDKNETDILLLMDKIVEWSKKAKEENKKMFTELFLAILRIQSYVSNLETLNKQSVAKYIGEVQVSKNTASIAFADKLKYESEILKLKNTIESLGKEIEFLSK